MNKQLLIASMAVLFMGFAGTAHADTLTGKVISIDQEANSIVLASTSGASSEVRHHKLVWDRDLPEGRLLKEARIGQTMTVSADQGLFSRNWKVKSLTRTLDGEILGINRPQKVMILQSKDLDAQGNPVLHRVVLDTSDPAVANRLNNARVGDSVTLTGEQSSIANDWKASSVADPMEARAEDDIRTLTGEIREVDKNRNFIVLYTGSPAAVDGIETLVWDNDFKHQARLESMKAGDQLSVRADQNILTRNWKVSSLN